MNNSSPTTLLLQDLISAPNKAESILECLTSEQINMIENTISRIKRRKMDKSHLPSPVASPPTAPLKEEEDIVMENSSSAAAIANALAAAMVSAALQVPVSTVSAKNSSNTAASATGSNIAASVTTVTPAKTVANSASAATAPVTSNDPIAEVKDGVEWVSFVYSHNRTLKRYSIRTDIQKVELDVVDDKFKAENCVYPRANLPKETYKGNRWAYETECNDLGWKLAWLNKAEIAGKRGLIQRAVDSYRNRYPSMRSRRVARQEKLLNGTLRKRKNREEDDDANVAANNAATSVNSANQQSLTCTSLEAATIKPNHQPKTIAIDDLITNARYRIKINVETVSLDEISQEFRKQNCPFPRAAATTNPEQYVGGRARWMEDTICNELCWKLAYLNPRVLAGKKNLLQRALDIYRSKFMPSLKPRKHSPRTAPARVISTPNATIEQHDLLKMMSTANTAAMSTPLTASALNAQNALFDKKKKGKSSTASGDKTTTSLDFGDCFSLDDETANTTTKLSLNGPTMTNLPRQTDADPMISPSYDSIYNDARFSPFDESSISCHTSSSSSANSVAACTPSPPVNADFFGFADSDLYDSFMLPPVNDTFMLLDSANNDMKCYDTLMSPSLPSSAVASQDLVKLEEDFQDNFSAAAHLLDPLF
ncbi:hypothetical protein MAM1_0334d09783 [Mucor ambiguus]|uniref:DUF8032 domain-containing protein n=1 Tax=Mucor ambiguus TaxID=91626 RepID=A0A0C9LXN3_9FUNG|nr:hypothetical protein MAM1_0334d09783 [Mucor ambiguus]